MKNTTLCYLERDSKVLLLHRIKKKNDENQGKWIGIGGKLEENESPEEGCVREFLEETGLRLTSFRYRGIITFASDRWEGEYMHLFSADGAEGELLCECDEGELAWIARERIPELPQWEGDKLFLHRMLVDPNFFTMKLTYVGDDLVDAVCNGEKLNW